MQEVTVFAVSVPDLQEALARVFRDDDDDLLEKIRYAGLPSPVLRPCG